MTDDSEPSFRDRHLRDFCTDAEAAKCAADMRAYLAGVAVEDRTITPPAKG